MSVTWDSLALSSYFLVINFSVNVFILFDCLLLLKIWVRRKSPRRNIVHDYRDLLSLSFLLYVISFFNLWCLSIKIYLDCTWLCFLYLTYNYSSTFNSHWLEWMTTYWETLDNISKWSTFFLIFWYVCEENIFWYWTEKNRIFFIFPEKMEWNYS